MFHDSDILVFLCGLNVGSCLHDDVFVRARTHVCETSVLGHVYFVWGLFIWRFRFKDIQHTSACRTAELFNAWFNLKSFRTLLNSNDQLFKRIYST